MTSDVSSFWDQGNTLGRILAALDGAGISRDSLGIDDLAPIDHLHARGLPATVELADRLPIEKGRQWRPFFDGGSRVLRHGGLADE